MSNLIRKWFSTDSNAAHHKLVETCLHSLKQSSSISPGDYYRLYRTLIDWSRLDYPVHISRRVCLELFISHFRKGTGMTERLACLLHFESLNAELAAWLVRTFPVLKFLHLEEHPSGEQIQPVALHILLFEPGGSSLGGRCCWARQLTQLLFQTRRAELWHILNPKLTSAQFPVLQNLAIYCAEPLCPLSGAALNLPILHQLREFYIYTADSFDAIWPALIEHINTRQPPKASTAPSYFELRLPLAAPLLYEVICRMTVTFAAAIGALHVVLPSHSSTLKPHPPKALSCLVRKFTALNYLVLETPPSLTASEHYPMLQLLDVLAQLDKLAWLHLRLHSYKQLPPPPPLGGAPIPVEVKLPHLKNVNIRIQEVRHGCFHTPTIVGLFPAVVRPLRVTFMHCEMCGEIGAKLASYYPEKAPPREAFNHCWGKVIVDAGEGDIYYKRTLLYI